MEAGCYPTENSYICLCHDLRPAGLNNSCDRSKELSLSSSSTASGVTDGVLSPTEGAFGPHQLLGMLSTSKLIPSNASDMNGGNITNSVFPFQTPLGYYGPSTAIIACLLSFFVVSLASLIIFIYRRHRNHLCWWLPGGRVRSTAAMSLSKCMQQYVTNPNYYSGSPDGPLLKALRDMEIPHENIIFLEEIGEGCFGKVHKGLYTATSGVTLPVAVKTLKDNVSPEAQNDFEREVEIMSSFCHENILKLMGVVMKDGESMPWMVFEFMQYGDLAQLLRSNSPFMRKTPTEHIMNLSQVDLIWISTQIANGMVYLSSQHFVHRDLATRNCLVGDNLSVKISDFGMSRDIYTSDYYKIGGSRMLPIRWMAPESITYGKFSLESDVWAYGVVLWEIFTFGKQPYYGHSNDEVVKLILQGILLSPPENCPPFIYNIMAGCWKTEPRDRLTFPEVYDRLLPHIPERQTDSTNTEEVEMMMDNDNYLMPTAVTVL
ncbi:tyrosine-protein kinase transmembrane receptor Ror-like [Stegodyphus dumicola]|uniref:tyrosine-protein kinase transmembrane receptor Ror-like n=1 Tax=Stegodyphus dumicola TaxID=202533 RepID=UPI0015A974FA|nr:tyrosine-protein kinase transmembrane receptor Ror-like [Stegodyphus dumicola]